ncbi:MAG TPA: glycosyltransferase family 4 protein [Candidatus Limiplasma sp.]|nr:glycosyltransferase family 4 protein [Candidatus Limiplasma sp.]HPS82386.1 glycosyltransferase family 4 protein [Candidatus Limiplasma sp.]
MTRKVLFVATVLRGHILVFHLPYMQWFQSQGYEVHCAARNDTGEPSPTVPFCDRYIEIPFERSPLNPGNRAAYRQLKTLMDTEGYALVHCHTPVGGMLARLAARASRKKGTRVLYTAHGFHFYSGAPVKNWLLYYPAERYLSRDTDLLITINREDYARAQRFHARQTALVNGVGVDLARFQSPVDRSAVRDALGLSDADSVVITVGEHIPRKNHEACLRAVAALRGVTLLFCGVGELTGALQSLAEELHITDRVRFLGFRADVAALLAASDVFLFPSFQEGLPVSLMEAMAAGLPCVVSRVRGNEDLIEPEEGGYLCAPEDIGALSEALNTLLTDPPLREAMGERNRRAIEAYSLPGVRRQMAALYQAQLTEGSVR